MEEHRNERLLGVLQAVFATRQPNREEPYNQNGFFLGTFSRFPEDDPAPDGTLLWVDRWDIEAVAYLDRNHYPGEIWGPDWGFCQFGTCSICAINVRSNVKNGVCPVCSTSVYMT